MADDPNTKTANAGDDADNQNQENTPGSDGGQNNQQHAEKTFTQEDVDRVVQDRLERERKKYEGFNEFKTKAERVDEVESKNTELAAQVKAFEDAKKQAKLAQKVAEDVGVPADALRGETEDELKDHAETLKELLQPQAPLIRTQAKSPGKVPLSDERQAAKQLFGND